jgi:nickel transport protein
MARIALVLLLLAPAPALAHKLNIFAEAKGDSIVGRVYFPGDVPARQTDVIARGRTGHELARTKTDDQGNFSFPATVKTDYQLTAETADGHSASYPLSAAELPDSLPADTSVAATQSHPSDKPADVRDAAINGTAPSPLIDQIVALQKQIQALRIQIDDSEQRFRFRDMLGGIGYILGLAGLGFYFKARQVKSMPALPKEH